MPLPILVLLGLLVFYWSLEYARHRRRLAAIPVRIHVNGTRGKSSVTRLIAAGLAAQGIRAFAKTTGTLPRVITPEGREYPVYRRQRPNINETLRIVEFAAANGAEALVIECMALQPHLQCLLEHRMVRSTIGVITNVRPDHLDVMGPEEDDVALALLGTVPAAGVLFSAEDSRKELFARVCAERGIRFESCDAETAATVSDAELAAFRYIEHRGNVALALAVCRELGVSRDRALAGMQAAAPDPGALMEYRVDFFGKTVWFVNGFAANDPVSTGRILAMARERRPEAESLVLLVNTRADRPDRSRGLGEAMADWPAVHRYILIGDGRDFLMRAALRGGIDPGLFVDAGHHLLDEIIEEIMSACGRRTLLVGIGNIAGQGLSLVRYFANRAGEVHG